MNFASGTASCLLNVEHAGNDAEHDAGGENARARKDGAPGDPSAPGAPGIVPSPNVAAGMPVSPSSAAPAATDIVLKLSAPETVRAGEQFTVVLDLTAIRAIEQLPLMIGYDPEALQMVGIQPGELVEGNGRQAMLNHQVDHPSGKISANAAWSGSSVSGQGSLMQVTFKAITQSEGAMIRLLSATPVPAGAPVKSHEISIQIQ